MRGNSVRYQVQVNIAAEHPKREPYSMSVKDDLAALPIISPAELEVLENYLGLELNKLLALAHKEPPI